MRSHRWRSVQSGLPESAHGCPELVKHALLVEANGMCRNRRDGQIGEMQGKGTGAAREKPLSVKTVYAVSGLQQSGLSEAQLMHCMVPLSAEARTTMTQNSRNCGFGIGLIHIFIQTATS